MALKIASNPGVCSLIWLKNFGEAIPLGNDPGTEYSNLSEPTVTFDGLVWQLIAWSDESHGDYSVELFDFSLIMAACVMPTKGVTKGQPTAIANFRKLGFHEIVVEKYGKYRHGLIYFHLTGSELEEALRPYMK